MDYDRTDIPAGYDRARDHGPEVLELWMDAIASQVGGWDITRILDVGCGTGRFSQALASRFSAEVIGIDPSAKMLARALEKRHDQRIHYVRGRAEEIALSSGSVDLVFMSMSLHHFTDQYVAARQCRRVLRRGGAVFVRTGTREQIGSYPYVPFFPSSRSLIEDLLPDIATLRALFEVAGFHMVAAELITQTIAPNWAVYADKLAAGGDSVLARLGRAELEGGLALVRRYAGQRADEAVVEPIDLVVFR